MSNLLQLTKNDENIQGQISLDGSKSISNRVLIIRALCSKEFDIKGLSTSDDTKAMQQALAEEKAVVDVGAAGTTMRFLTAFFATRPNTEVILTGSERMKQRPIGVLVDALRMLGADISYLENENCPPLHIKGKQLEGGEIEIDASVSSQYLSALLMIAPTLKQGLRLRLVGEMVSKPYLEMTLRIMQYFRITHEWHENVIFIAPQKYQAQDYVVEADWSAASYYYAMAAYSKNLDISLKGLYAQRIQGDSVLDTLMQQFGIETTYLDDGIRLQKNEKSLPTYFEYDFVECPDIAQTLAVVCAGLKINATFRGLSTLSIKETDRTAALQTELAKYDCRFFGEKDAWHLESQNFNNNNIKSIATYHDHRMAMSFAPLAMQLKQGLMIENPSVVSKSYPNFWQDIQQLGFNIENVTNS
ncbi:MAG: 3-phosphoshikimate 1-carboxyvinyltransferase [Chitinophagales bacterium]